MYNKSMGFVPGIHKNAYVKVTRIRERNSEDSYFSIWLFIFSDVRGIRAKREFCFDVNIKVPCKMLRVCR